MAELAALGLACNVMQVISFTGETISVCKQIFARGSADPALTDFASKLITSMEKLKQSSLSTTPATQASADLADAAEAVSKTAADLLDILGIASSQGSVKASVKSGIMMTFNMGRIRKLERELDKRRKLVETEVLAHLHDRTDAISLRQSQDFVSLDTTLRQFVSAFSDGKTKVEELLAMQTRTITDHTMRLQEAVLDRISADGHATRQKVDEQSDGAMLGRISRSLRYPAMNGRYSSIADAHDETFTWIFETGLHQFDFVNHSSGMRISFMKWLSNPSHPICWISGKAGSGKSTLIKFLIDHRQTENILNSTGSVLLSHFMWAADRGMQSTYKGALCSLLHQLIRDDTTLTSNLVTDYPSICPKGRPKIASKDSPDDWSETELEATLSYALGCRLPACIFLDGVDEISQKSEQKRLLDLMHKLAEPGGVKVCISSRPEPFIVAALRSVPALRVQDLTAGDMQKYVRHSLSPYFTRYSGELERLIEAVVDKSDGVFLWVSLALKSLEPALVVGQDDPREIWSRLDHLPADLSHLYHDMWQRQNKDDKTYRVECARYLRLLLGFPDILGTDSPMELHELVLAADPTTADEIIRGEYDCSEYLSKARAAADRIQMRCAGLVEVDPIQDEGQVHHRVQLLHRSAYEFLACTDEGKEILAYDISTEEDREFRILNVNLALMRIMGALGSYDSKEISSYHGYWSTLGQCYIDDFFDHLRMIDSTRNLSPGNAYKFLSNAGKLFAAAAEQGWLEREETVHPRIEPAVLQFAARFGFYEGLETAIKHLSPTSRLPARLGGYLVIQSLRNSFSQGPFTWEDPAVKLHLEMVPFPDHMELMLSTAEILWKDGIDPNMVAIIGAVPRDFVGEHIFLEPVTPMVTLIRLALDSTSCLTARILVAIERMIDLGADLTSTTLISIVKSPRTYQFCRMDSLIRFLESKGDDNQRGIIIEVNLACLVRVYLCAVAKVSPGNSTVQQLLEKIQNTAVEDSANPIIVGTEDKCGSWKGIWLGDRDAPAEGFPGFPCINYQASGYPQVASVVPPFGPDTKCLWDWVDGIVAGKDHVENYLGLRELTEILVRKGWLEDVAGRAPETVSISDWKAQGSEATAPDQPKAKKRRLR
ncbi:hypothetical protein MFIFM68171_00927 [Madurella fahalii]|uniref:NACHT domain-containing protein n=1 Tax=Madurella fahalii TaxID=1157608 RepID=A0ABQ0FYX7_9PEZI